MFLSKMTNRTLTAIYIVFLLSSLCFYLSAQEKPETQKVLIDGKTYILYMAVSGDSPFSIARKFGITFDDLNNANPEIKNQLNSGQTIKIPVIVIENKSQNNVGLQNNSDEDHLFTFYSVRKKETVFSIAKKRNVTLEDIYKFNPQAKEGIKAGDVLKILKPQTSLNKQKIDNTEIQKVLSHEVGRKETLFSIAKKYNTSQEEILKANPSVKGILSKGTVLIIPQSSSLSGTQFKSDDATIFTDYLIVSGDNFFQLEKHFGISKTELIKLNPALKDGIKTGMIIKIPSKELSNNKSLDDKSDKKLQPDDSSLSTSQSSFSNLNKTFEIGLFLPFCQNLNDSLQISQKTSGFLEFYSGVLLATQKMTDAGMKLKLFVYDTYQDSRVVERLVNNPEFLSFDLIIGPVYPDNQKIVAELSAKNHIPMISPLSSDSRFVSTTPGYYQINPERRIRIASTADYITDKYAGQNIIMLSNDANSGDEKLIYSRLNQKIGNGKVRLYNIWNGDALGLEAYLSSDVENIIVLAEASEANVSVALTRLNTISKICKLTVVGIQEYTKMQSINIEYLHNTSFHYLSPYFIDYKNVAVNAFVEKYRMVFYSEPTQYSFQGYDIALHFMASLRKSGRNFPNSNPASGVELLQASYNVQKLSDLGGYINRTLYIIEYSNNYEVRSSGKFKGVILKGNGNDKNVLDQ